jgi:hypothetical protein
VLAELKRVIPKNDSGRRKGKLAQALTPNIGYPKLREHLGAVVAFMKLSEHYPDFVHKLDRFYPRFGDNYALPLEYQPEADDGKGL